MKREVEIRGAKHEEVRKFLDLLESLENTNEDAEKYKLFIKARYPYFPPEYIRIAVSDGEVLAGLLILPEFVKLGESRFKTAVVGKVFSSNFNNYKGIASRIIRDSLHYIEKHKFNFSYIFRVPRMYQRFGFVPTFFEYHFDLRVRKKVLKRLEPTAYEYRIRRVKPADVPVIQKIHDYCEEGISYSILRTHSHYSLKWREIKNMFVIFDILGRIHGYFYFDIEWKQILTVKEVGCLSRESFEPLFYFILKWAERFGCMYVRFLVPPEFQMLNWLKEAGFSLSPCAISRSAIGMATIHNTEETLQCLIPEWEKLLHLSDLKYKELELTLLLDSGTFNIFARNGDILISNRLGKNKITIGRDELTYLVMGLESGEDLINEGIIGISDDAKQLIKILFPKRYPYIWSMDRL